MEQNDDILIHYGMPRRSGRYPWGSGEDPYQHSGDFLSRVNELKAAGLTEKQMALTLDTLNDEQVVHIKLAQKSALELMQEQHSADISALDAAILEIGELLGGESNG